MLAGLCQIERVKVSLSGGLTAARARAVFEEIESAASGRPVAVKIDFGAVGEIDTAGIAAVLVASRDLERRGIQVDFVNLSPSHRRVLAAIPPLPPPAAAAPRRGMFERIGARSRARGAATLALAEMAVDTARGTIATLAGRRPFQRGAIVDQMIRIGVDAFSIIAMLSFLLGTVLAFQTWVQLRAFGADLWTTNLVGIGMAREFGPFIVAIILAGRSGSAIAAELSTMEMREENDALRVLGISPVRHLVVPRLIAITLVVPGLSLLSTAIGIAGGILVTDLVGVPLQAATDSMLASMSLDDITLGLVKSVLFGWVIGLASCHTGLHSGADARSVGTAATRAVVSSIFFIIVIDSVVTTAWTLGHE